MNIFSPYSDAGTFRRLAVAAWLAAGLSFHASAADATAAAPMVAYVGTYTGAKSKGIYRAQFDTASGTLSPLTLAAETPSPSFVIISPDHKFLFAANETGSFQGKPTGSVSSFAIDPASGALTAINSETSGGSGPCHLSTDAKGAHIFVANYGSGSFEVLPVGHDGHIGQPTSFIQDKGTGANPQRQEGPHAHFILPDHTGRRVLGVDLGLDKVFVFKFDPTRGVLTENEPPFVKLADGVGPRHFVFSHDGKFLHVVNELGSSVTTFAYDPRNGSSRDLGTVSTVPAGYSDKGQTCAEIEIHPSGRFVYASNRGHDSIAIFSVAKKEGTLTLVGNEPTRGRAPRHFMIDPTGNWLIAANQLSDSLAVFQIDAATGKLTPHGDLIQAGSPVCVQFYRLR